MKVLNKPETNLEGQNFLTILQNCLAAGIIVVNSRNQIATFTGEAVKITGLDPEKILHRDVIALPSPLRKIIRSVSTSGESVNNAGFVLHSRSRGDTLINVSATPLNSGKTKNPRGAILVLHDITPSRKLEEMMRRLDRLASIGTLSASTAHEIKNALVAVKTFMDLLLEKHSDGELGEIVRREMKRIDSIVSQLLRYAAPPRSAFSSVHLHEVLEHSLHTVQSQLLGKQISLTRNLQATNDSVKGDDYQLQQAFVNLLLNSIEAVGPAGEITITTETARPPAHSVSSSKQHVHVTIADNGSGISPENIGRLFEPFFTTKKHGTGLGLSITQRIIQGHRGFMDIESDPGKGATFQISFPVFSAT